MNIATEYVEIYHEFTNETIQEMSSQRFPDLFRIPLNHQFFRRISHEIMMHPASEDSHEKTSASSEGKGVALGLKRKEDTAWPLKVSSNMGHFTTQTSMKTWAEDLQ